jgi:hypothetical protein
LIAGRKAFDNRKVRLGGPYYLAKAYVFGRPCQYQAPRATAHAGEVASACQRIDHLLQMSARNTV